MIPSFLLGLIVVLVVLIWGCQAHKTHYLQNLMGQGNPIILPSGCSLVSLICTFVLRDRLILPLVYIPSCSEKIGQMLFIFSICQLKKEKVFSLGFYLFISVSISAPQSAPHFLHVIHLLENSFSSAEI